MKIKNISLRNMNVSFSVGSFAFDNEGVADIKPDEFAEHILATVPNFTKVEISDNKKVAEAPKVEEVKKEQETEENVLEDAIEISEIADADESMSHEELDAIADGLIEEGLLEEADYPRKKAKKDKVKAINSAK